MYNEIIEKLQEMENRIKVLEDSIVKLREEEKEIVLYIMNKGNSNKSNEGLLNILEKQIVNYDENRKSTFITKNIESVGVKIFISLNQLLEADKDKILPIIDEMTNSIQNKNLDERYIELLDTAKKISAIVENPETFTMIVLDNGKTYAYAEGDANIYAYDNGSIIPLKLTNTIAELHFEVLNSNDYVRLILFSYCDDNDDLSDDKIKIITKKTNRDDLVKELI